MTIVDEFESTRLDVQFIVLETSPVTWDYSGQEYTWKPGSLLPSVKAAIEPALVPDETTCALCTKAVGYVLRDDDDTPQSNGVEWVWTTVAWYGKGTNPVLLCEECSPHSLRDHFEQMDRSN